MLRPIAAGRGIDKGTHSAVEVDLLVVVQRVDVELLNDKGLVGEAVIGGQMEGRR